MSHVWGISGLKLSSLIWALMRVSVARIRCWSVVIACNCLSRRFVHWTSSLSSYLADSFHHYQAHNLTTTTIAITTTISPPHRHHGHHHHHHQRAVVRPQQRDVHSNVIEITISLGDGTRDGSGTKKDSESSSEDSSEFVESLWNFEREDVRADNTRCS